MGAFLDFLRFIFSSLLTIVVGTAIAVWFVASMETYTYTKQNNVLLKELCVENGLNIDSLISTTQNDPLNLKIDVKGE